MRLPEAREGLLLLLTLLPAALAFAGNTSIDPRMDALERQLEMGRHKQLVAQKRHPDSKLAEFTTDGCSGWLSVGWEFLANRIEAFQDRHGIRPPWESCCIKHDRAYHTGGERELNPDKSFDARKIADRELKACVLETGVQRTPELSAEYQISARDVKILYTAIADLLYRSVRIGGVPCTGLPWRWGYGWPECE